MKSFGEEFEEFRFFLEKSFGFDFFLLDIFYQIINGHQDRIMELGTAGMQLCFQR